MTVINAIRTATNQAQQAMSWIQRIPLRFRNQVMIANAQFEAVPDAKPSARERQVELVAFYTKYEQLVELLCDGAQYGPNQRMESQYQEYRDWMLKSYPHMKQYVVAYLELDVDDVRRHDDTFLIATDAFESLWACPTLSSQLDSDDGSTIGRIIRTREALNRYAEHLRRLAA